jgi:flagellar biosynthesis regulator FlbT
MKIDEMIDSDEGNKALKEIRKKIGCNGEGINANSIGNGTGCTANVVLITP